jgi:hypothetical protein
MVAMVPSSNFRVHSVVTLLSMVPVSSGCPNVSSSARLVEVMYPSSPVPLPSSAASLLMFSNVLMVCPFVVVSARPDDRALATIQL